jgi:hypothetical protein
MDNKLKKKLLFFLPNCSTSMKLITKMNSVGILNEFQLINIFPNGELTKEVPEDTLQMILKKNGSPALIVPDVNGILIGLNAKKYIEMYINTNQKTNNINNKISDNFKQTFKGEGVNEKELVKLSDDYTTLDEAIEIKKNCFNSMEKFEEEIIQLNDLDLLNNENQQKILDKMLVLRKNQDTIFQKSKETQEPTKTVPHTIGGSGCKRISNIKKSNQLGTNLINTKMNSYKFNQS